MDLFEEKPTTLDIDTEGEPQCAGWDGQAMRMFPAGLVVERCGPCAPFPLSPQVVRVS